MAVDEHAAVAEQIGAQARCDATAVGQSEAVGGQAGGLADPARQVEEPGVAPVVAEHAGKRARPARVGLSGHRDPVRADHRRLEAEHVADVALVHGGGGVVKVGLQVRNRLAGLFQVQKAGAQVAVVERVVRVELAQPADDAGAAAEVAAAQVHRPEDDRGRIDLDLAAGLAHEHAGVRLR